MISTETYTSLLVSFTNNEFSVININDGEWGLVKCLIPPIGMRDREPGKPE